MNEVEVFLVADKGEAVGDLAQIRTEILRRHVRGEYRVISVPDPERDRTPRDYGAAVADWHDARARAYEKVLLGLDADVMNEDVRCVEVRNWINHLVLPNLRL